MQQKDPYQEGCDSARFVKHAKMVLNRDFPFFLEYRCAKTRVVFSDDTENMDYAVQQEYGVKYRHWKSDESTLKREYSNELFQRLRVLILSSRNRRYKF